MEVAVTKISQNGQIVIPAEIRRDAGIKPFAKFIVFNEDGNICLKQIRTHTFSEEMKLIEQIRKSEDQIQNGKFIKADHNMSAEQIDALLMR